MTKVFVPFFLVLSSATHLMEEIIGVHKLFDNYSEIHRSIIVLDLRGCCKQNVFEKKGIPSSEKNVFGFYFLVLSNMANVKKRLMGAKNVFSQVLCKPYDDFFRT